jgi:trigger factor
MNITRENKDALNAVVKIDIEKSDYAEKVEKILTDYRKSANIPGFRKGQVPMGLVKKQYGKAVLAEEVNKLLQESLGKYLNDEKLDVLGNPLPKAQDDIDWDTDAFSFEFEIGLSPEFDIKLKGRKAITQYTIVADDKMVQDQITNIQKQYGQLISKSEASEGDELTGVFFNDEAGIESTTTISLDKLKGKSNLKKFIGAKSGDIITVKSKGLFKEAHDLTTYLKIDQNTANDLNVQLTFTVNEINERGLADLDQELFDKLFGKDVVKTVTELKEKIKADAEKQFVQQSDQKLLNDVTEYLVENTKFDLPAEFLQKWLQTVGEEPMNEAQAKEEYEKSEKSMRYQLIESKLIVDNNLQVNFEELKAYAGEMIKGQMAQFGQLNPSDKEVEDIVARVLSNQDEVKRMSEQLTSQKLLSFYKDNAKLKAKEMSYEAFVKEVYGK